MDLDQLEPYACMVRDAALALVQDERGVRVEDYLTVLAAATGEAAIVASGVLDIEHNDLTPGAAVFGDAINAVLTGDALEVTDVPASSVVGVLRDRLVPGVATLDDLGSLERVYRLVAESVSLVPWGDVAVTVSDDHRHAVLPLQVAFELRPVVTAARTEVEAAMDAGSLERPDGWGSHVLGALALASAVEQTSAALDIRTALTLAFEVVFGMAKTVPMSRAAFEAADDEG